MDHQKYTDSYFHNETLFSEKGDIVNKYTHKVAQSLKRPTTKSYLINIVFLLVFLIEICFLVKILQETKLGIYFIKNSNSYETVEYRGASITYYKNEFPKERLYVFYTVVDSLVDDVNPKYAVGKYPMNVYIFKRNFLDFIDGNIAGFANRRNMSIFLKSLLFAPEFNDRDIAMTILHEYVHIVQYGNDEYMTYYAEKVGWKDPPEERDLSFFKVLDDYSLTNPLEDMASTFMYSYLCENNIEALSQERKEEIFMFWSVPREQFCRSF